MQQIPEIGCVACKKLDPPRHTIATVHHITECGRRIRNRPEGSEHRFTLGLCPWHHQGIPLFGARNPDTETLLGPSFDLNKRAFVARFGSEMELLADQDALIEAAGRAAKFGMS